MRSIHQGFTLIELMIAIAIIAILVTISISSYSDYIGRAQMAEAFSIANGLKSPVIEYYTSFGECPENGKDYSKKNGFGPTKSYAGQYVEAARVGVDRMAYCSIWVKMRKTGVASGIKGKILNLELRKNSTPGAYVWGCISEVEQKYLPSACQGGFPLPSASGGFD